MSPRSKITSFEVADDEAPIQVMRRKLALASAVLTYRERLAEWRLESAEGVSLFVVMLTESRHRFLEVLGPPMAGPC